MKESHKKTIRRLIKDEKAFNTISKIIKDIEKNKQEIEESEFKYRQIFKLSPEAIVLLDREGNVLEVNGRLKDFLDYEREDVIGINLMALPYLPEHSKKKAGEMFTRRMKGEHLPPYALDFTTKKLERKGHVSGQELLEGIRDYALELFGPMARTVLEYWGIKNTRDFGEIVFNMIDAGLLGKAEQDSREDFENVYDFKAVFDKGFKFTLH